jgi:uncharacterized membrane protein
MKTNPMAIGIVIVSTIFISFAQISFKFASSTLTFDIFSMVTNHFLVIGVLTYALAAAMMLVALKHGDLSVLYPMVAASYIWVSLLSPMFFPTDSMNITKWFGIILVVAGVSAVGLGGRNG